MGINFSIEIFGRVFRRKTLSKLSSGHSGRGLYTGKGAFQKVFLGLRFGEVCGMH